MIAALRLHVPSDADAPEQLTLRAYYLESILPEIQHEQAPSSLSEDRTALNHWERYTSNPALADINAQHLAQLRDGLAASGAAPATVNKCWRELRSMFNWAADDGAIEKAPQISRRSKSRLVKQPPKRQRETLTDAEVARLWLGCRKATYPANQHSPAPQLWRVAIVLWYFYGARTLDVIGQLKWANILWSDRLLQFTAQKTGKLQGLPLTPLVIEHLKSIRGPGEKVFPGFNTKGCWLHENQKWKRGYYTTWRNEIQRDAKLQGIWIKHFREAMLTRNNGIEPGLGNWIAGHYMPGVSAQNYDLPTKRIREAVESTPVPECFREIG